MLLMSFGVIGRVNTSGFIETKGRVVDYNTKYDYDSGYMYAIIVEFAVDGETYRIESSAYSMYQKLKGTVVDIKYNPHNPNEAVFTGNIENGNSLIGLVGGVFTLAGVVMLIGSIVEGVKKGKGNNI